MYVQTNQEKTSKCDLIAQSTKSLKHGDLIVSSMNRTKRKFYMNI